MNRDQVQSELFLLYTEWKNDTTISGDYQPFLSPPLLLHVPEEYCQSDIRVIVFGQETYGWSWTKDLCEKYPDYPTAWSYSDIVTMRDFFSDSDAVEGLCWGYKEFRFAERQPITRRSPFWNAFREVQQWPGVGVVWSNLVRCDFDGGSVLRAPPELQTLLVKAQADLLVAELAILKPHVCLFFTGHYYDRLIQAILPGSELRPACDLSVQQMAKVIHPHLPSASLRTYHPRYLRQGGCWDFIDKARQLVFERAA